MSIADLRDVFVIAVLALTCVFVGVTLITVVMTLRAITEKFAKESGVSSGVFLPRLPKLRREDGSEVSWRSEEDIAREEEEEEAREDVALG